VRCFRCHKNLNHCTKRKLEIDDRARIRMNNIYNSLAVETGGMSILHLERKIAVIILRGQDIFALAQEVLQHFVTTSIEFFIGE
jgi:hypothetical protein